MKFFAVIVSTVAVIFLFSLLFALPVMWLWDWLMPELFGLKTITWLQAWGLTMLCNLLFKATMTCNKD